MSLLLKKQWEGAKSWSKSENLPVSFHNLQLSRTKVMQNILSDCAHVYVCVYIDAGAVVECYG
jgi:hypothetical protein